MRLEGKVAIVTGGASGIGLGIAKDFFNEGAKVVIADYNENVKEIASELGDIDKVIGLKIDVSKEEDVDLLFKKTINNFGNINIVVANAGISSKYMCHEQPIEEWNDVIGTNLTGVYLTNKYGINYMLNSRLGGSIINVTSILGIIGTPGAYAYTASKGAIISMTKNSAITYARNNIRINAIAPGYVKTPILNNIPDNTLNIIANNHPIGRLGTPEEIAKVVTFLASNDSSFITGEIITADGGYTAR